MSAWTVETSTAVEGFFWDGLTGVESPGEVLVHELVEIHVNLPSFS
jgi:hypothetical protein